LNKDEAQAEMACSEVVPSRKWEIKAINLLNALAIDNSCSIAAISKLEVLDSTCILLKMPPFSTFKLYQGYYLSSQCQ